jgi:protein O-GlcNAc transferase
VTKDAEAAQVRSKLERAFSLLKGGQLEPAEIILREILARDPEQPEANHALGMMAVAARELPAALPLLRRGAAGRPDQPGYTLNYAIALQDAGQADESLAVLAGLIKRQPRLGEAHAARGRALMARHELSAASAAYREACAVSPADLRFAFRLVETLLGSGALDEAESRLNPLRGLPGPAGGQARRLSADLLLARKMRWAAVKAYTAILQENPADTGARANLAELWRSLGHPDRAAAEAGEVVRRAPADHYAYSNRIVALFYLEGATAELLCTEGREWSRRYSPARLALPPALPLDPPRRLRLGYYSNDWREHATCVFTRHLLRHHDRRRFEIFIYQDSRVADALTAELKTHADHWQETWKLPPAIAAAAIAADRLDVLVDIPGHFSNPRVTITASGPARTIIHYLAHAGTTGIASVGWRIADAIVEPPPDNPRESSERLLRLPRGIYPYLGPTRAAEINPLPALSRGQVTFGSANSLAKISPGTIRAWAAVMAAVPAARLVVVREEFHEAEVQADTTARFAAAGFPVERLELVVADGNFMDLSLYHALDISLDTMPYNGVTTTCDALWMGVPVLTIPGDRNIARCSASILTHLGRAEWIARDSAQLAGMAAALAADLPRLAAMRAGLRDEFRRSSLGQVAALTRDFEAAYEEAIRRQSG